ncbi:MAG: hypothetical protein A3G81_19120 [Betaproteobacteria bacterium RIFCSPLOWO2_12_FULL_65_14]|nr:MAG: hypothetical protein A3G81_19120 [Betaproteobacteria bacterium RIFCSPLOWO2_12_FULL_65_14]
MGVFQFGEQLPGYGVPVLNERAVRAGAGMLFLLAIVSFMNAWLMGNFQPTRVFVVAFLIDFTLRLFVNPRYAPSLILGQWVVRKQQPEFVGAPQKRFAWAIGFVLALTMLYLVVLNNVIGPINLIVCAACLTLLFYEAAFGICIGCKLYNLFNREQAELCPGGVCEVAPAKGSGVNLGQIAIVAVFAGLVGTAAQWVYSTGPQVPARAAQPGMSSATAPIDPAEAERCKVPDFAKALGHEEKWKLHNNCK